MSQKLVLAEIDGETFIVSSVDKEDLIEYAVDNELFGELYFESIWFSFGIGEDGETFISDDEIEEMIKNGKDMYEIADEFENRGYYGDVIQRSSGTIDTTQYADEEY